MLTEACPAKMVGLTKAVCMRTLLSLLLCLAFAVPALAEPFRVVDVADGDTITVEPRLGGNRVKIRLHGIDAPKLRQPHGQAARRFVINAVLYKLVNVQPTPQGKDRYGRTIAIVDVPGVGILQEMLLQAGLAWVYPQYCKDCKEWEAMQAEAKAQQRGLWARKGVEGKAVPPWEWRKAHSAGVKAMY